MLAVPLMRLMIRLPFSFLLNFSVELSCWTLPFQTKEIPWHFSDSLMAQDLKKRRIQTWHIALELEGNPHALTGLEHQYSQLWAESQLPLENFLSLSMLYPLSSEKAFPVYCPYYFTVIIKTVRFHSFHMSENGQCTLFWQYFSSFVLNAFRGLDRSYNLRKVMDTIPQKKCTCKMTQ